MKWLRRILYRIRATFSKNVWHLDDLMEPDIYRCKEICRHTPVHRMSPCISQLMPIVSCPMFSFFQVQAAPQICSFCTSITVFPTVKKVRHITVLTYGKANWLPSMSVYSFISACGTQHRQFVADKTQIVWSPVF